MISVEMYFHPAQLSQILESLADLPADLAPVRFSQDQRVALADDLVSDFQRFSAFVESSSAGFFLHGRKAVFMVFPRDEKLEVFACNLSTGYGELVFRKLIGASPIFGYAAVLAERYHRNMLKKKDEPGRTIESWVGRDIDRYIPGLYWLTWLSTDYLRMRHVDPLAIAAVARRADEVPGGWAFCFFDKPSEWENEAKRIDDFCAATDGVFSANRAREAFAASTGLHGASIALKEWP